MKSGIYKITHVSSEKMYIGSAVSIRRRITTHKHSLKKGSHHSQKLQRAWNKYGEDAFEFKTVLVCSRENLLMYEQTCIDGYDSARANMSAAQKRRFGSDLKEFQE